MTMYSQIETIDHIRQFDDGQTELVANRVVDDLATGDNVLAWADCHTRVGTIGSRQFRYVEDIPADFSGNVVITSGEYGNGMHAGLVARALVIREVVDPRAALYIQPNDTIREHNQNFSREERADLHEGNTQPVIDRILTMVDRAREIKDGAQILYGPSQSAAVLSSYAAKHSEFDAIALTVVEPPHVKARTATKLAKAFLSSGSYLGEAIASNFEYDPTPDVTLREDLASGITLDETLAYLAGCVLPNNVAMLGLMKQCMLLNDLSRALDRGAAVVHAWGTVDAVSPDDRNACAADHLLRHNSYRAIRIADHKADHSLSNRYALNAWLTKQSFDLLNAHDSLSD